LTGICIAAPHAISYGQFVGAMRAVIAKKDKD